MKRNTFCILALIIFSLTTFSQATLARNDSKKFPIAEVTQTESFKQVQGSTLKLTFGKAEIKDMKVLGEIKIQGVGRVVNFIPNTEQRLKAESDEVRCPQAMVDAMSKIVAKAKELGAAAVQIVDYHDNIESGDGVSYECRAGFTRTVVVVKAKFIQ